MLQEDDSMTGGEVEIVGFPKFWQQAHDLRQAAFDAIHDIDAVQISLLKKLVKSPLEAVIRHMVKINCNSLSALVTILMNGHGSDGHENRAQHVGNGRDGGLSE